LKPVKAKELIPEVAATLNVSEELVHDIISYFYQEVRMSVSTLRHQRINVPHLGDFVIKHWKIEDRIKNIEALDESNNMKGLQLINARFRTAENLYNLNNMKKMLEKEKDKKEFIRLHKKTVYESKREHNTDMEEQKPDTRGAQE